jgi:phage antirepressor YoqD-like protein
MLTILQNNSVLKMSSRELSSLTDKRHDHVLRDIRTMFSKLNLAPTFGEVSNGPQDKEFYLDQFESMCLVSGYDTQLRMKIIKRWHELENKTSHILPQSFAEALQLAATQAAELEAARPAVAFVEKYVESTGNMGFREVCKLLKVKEPEFRRFLKDYSIMYQLAGQWTAYAEHINAGRFYVTTGTADNDRSFTSAKFTPKGVQWVAKLWSMK